LGFEVNLGENIKYEDLIKWSSADVHAHGTAVAVSTQHISSISTDSRTINAGDFFIPIIGENFDGHEFIRKSIKKGCAGFVFQKDHLHKMDSWKDSINPDIWNKLIVLQTENTVDFLLGLAANYIRQFDVKVIGITGSVGKTTTKDFLVNILSRSFNIGFTPENYNTEIGVTKSVLEIGKTTEIFIAELGMRSSGQIMQLCEVIGPEIGAITSVTPSHLEFFNSIEEIALAKAEIGFWLKSRNGILFLNNDDEWTDYIIKKTGCDFKKFGGRNGNLDYSFIEKDCDDLGRYSIDFYTGKKDIPDIKLKIPGFHNIYNACCAASIADYLGVSGPDIKNGLEGTSIEENIIHIFNRAGKIIINDCYNANPLSMKRAVDTLKLAASKNSSRSVAVLSDMLELGRDSEKLHFNLGEYIFDSGIDVLITIGKLSGYISEGFKHAMLKDPGKNTDKDRIYHFKDKKNLAAKLAKILNNSDTVLIKGSRANRLETLIDYI
jgi:UDP-N-acetylmuramoyl-tripeptide--D-alanyl-D-alanine ligase